MGLRYIELDIPDGSAAGTIHIGHSLDDDEDRLAAGSRGNPDSDKFGDWFKVILNWSEENPGHDPITVAIEVKNGEGWGTSDWEKLIASVGGLFSGNFSDNLVTPSSFNKDTTTLAEVKGKIFVVSIPNNGNLPTNQSVNNCIFKCFDQDDDRQANTSDSAYHNALFYTRHANAISSDDITIIRAENKSIRLCEFNSDYTGLPATNYPSSDTPYYGWYARYCENMSNLYPDFGFSQVTWDQQEYTYDTGIEVDAAANNAGMVVEVHGAHSSDELWYNTGALQDDGTISWFPLSDDQRRYISGGVDPTVAINDLGTVVEIHSTDGDHLYYRTGVLNSSSGVIEWLWTPSSGQYYDKGKWPSVAINNDNWVVEVHNSEGESNCWYNVGKVEQDGSIIWGEITWDDTTKSRNYDTGQYPSVAISGDRILEAHNSEANGDMWCTVGRLNEGAKAIDWIDWVDDEKEYKTYAYSFEEDGSVFPDVALIGQTAFEVHRSSSTDCLWWRPGKGSNRVMAWGGSEKINLARTTMTPSLAITGQHVLVFYSDISGELSYRSGTLSQ
jgi:hypothetical protein